MNQGCKDHLGNAYPSLTKMCKAYDIDIYTYCYRTRSGWGLEKILTTPKKRREPSTDHLGNKYKNSEEMCKAYGVARTTYVERLKRGWTKEEALTNKRYQKNSGER